MSSWDIKYSTLEPVAVRKGSGVYAICFDCEFGDRRRELAERVTDVLWPETVVIREDAS